VVFPIALLVNLIKDNKRAATLKNAIENASFMVAIIPVQVAGNGIGLSDILSQCGFAYLARSTDEHHFFGEIVSNAKSYISFHQENHTELQKISFFFGVGYKNRGF
jgi:hypothetical protein